MALALVLVVLAVSAACGDDPVTDPRRATSCAGLVEAGRATAEAVLDVLGERTVADLEAVDDARLFAEIEHDHTVYGEECWTGAGRVMRDGMAYDAHTSRADGAIDMLIENATIIDPVLGVIKADIGVRDGKIAGVGKAGNPNIQDGIDENLVCGPNTTY